MRSLTLHTTDGHELEADLADPPDSTPTIGGAVVCHPHPLHGGNRFNNVVEALFDALPTAGFTTLRFDFRAEHDGGRGEREDVIAALTQLESCDAGPLVVAGYSFGALVALATRDPRITGIVAVAPPLTVLKEPLPSPIAPTLILTPAHDQFCTPDQARQIAGEWDDVEVEVVESTDHFLLGKVADAAQRAAAWLSQRP